MRVLLFDYGTGNLHSLRKALELQGASVTTGTDFQDTDALILPGVGAFGAAADRLAAHRDAIREAVAAGLPLLGICLGMQLLLDASAEGSGNGLGLVPGTARRLRATRVPHMGWNAVTARGEEPLLRGIDGERFYFANSYVAEPADRSVTTGMARHETDTFPAVVRAGSALGTQFHPEKSGRAGLRLLRNFMEAAG